MLAVGRADSLFMNPDLVQGKAQHTVESPPLHDRLPGPGTEHQVKFYDSEPLLIEWVADSFVAGATAGDGLLLVATPPHRRAIQRALRERGVDVAALRGAGQYVALDAKNTLAGFMTGDRVDGSAFERSIGSLVARLATERSHVRAFGEMVALLAATGNHREAWSLESLWNGLLRRHDLELLCAYPMHVFRDEASDPWFVDICAAHSRIVPDEQPPPEADPHVMARTIAALQQKTARLAAEIENRKAAEQELSDFVENAALGFDKIGPDGVVSWANEVQLRMLGYGRDQYVGHPVSEFHVDRERLAEMLARLEAGESIRQWPASLRCGDGSIRHVIIDGNGRFANGKLLYARNFTRDVTDGVQADRERAMLAAIVESSDDAIITKTFDGIIRSWNKGAQRLFGYSEEEAIGRPITMLIPPDRIAEEHEILQRLQRGESIDHYETVRVAKTGAPLDISLTISPMRDRAGNLIGASKIARDITDRKHSENALRESERRFASFMRCLPGLAWIKDAEGRYVYANEAAARVFGLDAGSYGRTDDDLFDAETAAQFRQNDEKALASHHGVKVIETLEHADGVHHSLVSKFAIEDGQGNRTFIGGVAIDVTERMRAEQALVESDRRKDEFLATLAHELRNPLAPIRNSLQILRMVDQSPMAARVHEMMERQVSQMVRLVDDLLEVSRISRGKIVLRKETILLDSVIHHAVETSRPGIEGAAHALSVELPEGPIYVDADLVRLSQVFANLLNNAAKYTDRGGTISVRASVDAGTVCISVRDSGIGIQPHMLGRVFDMFAQVENPLRRSQDGLGIGLSLVRTLVLLHGGTVEARSEGLGHGSEFRVTLPVAEHAADGLHPRRAPEDHGTPLVTTRVLVVDDNRDAADSLAMMLRFLGGDVHVVYDGATAIDAMRIFRPSVVLMDLGMPGMDGCDVARQIRSEEGGHGVLLIALTGWGQDEDRRRSREAGFDHHMVKPVDLPALQALLATVAQPRPIASLQS